MAFFAGEGRRPPWPLGARSGRVLAGWLLLLLAEYLAVTTRYAPLFAGSWELARMRGLVLPIAVGALAPAAVLAATVGGWTARAGSDRRYRLGLGAAFAVAVGALAHGVSAGRHFASWTLRAPWVLGLAGLGFAGVVVLLPGVLDARRRWPRLLSLASFSAALGLLVVDAQVLPRLYPAFHLAVVLGALVAAAASVPSLAFWPFGAGFVALGLGCFAWAPFASRRLAPYDNLRLLLLEHAPLEGRAVRVAAWLAPPPPEDETTAPLEGEGARAPTLDWSGKDIVLVTVDALRADHVSAYGYPRNTTPNLDALAREGTLFAYAYCPTPHTSYSITSMMTGKYMRPLLALGLGDDSETWASMLRRYGYRTAAFYPPAVFFIDEARFRSFRDRGFDFEYRKVEFAAPPLREAQLEAYLMASADENRGLPRFLWVHFFEPHEPYVQHPEHFFGPSDVDAYDSEVATADDGIGAVVRAVRARSPDAVVIVTADHGEEFGDHGGRYHGTTVYEEQVRVPLVVVGPGVSRGAKVDVPVQTIDLLPTTLSALRIPRPARVRGRDLGEHLTPQRGEGAPESGGGGEGSETGLAFAETDDFTLLARGASRLVCERRIASCALYQVDGDPRETRDRAAAMPAEVAELRRREAAIEAEHGRFERGEATEWPEALRRAMAGDGTAARDVAELLDDASRAVRAKAGEVLFDEHPGGVATQLRRAATASDDPDVRRFAALALARTGGEGAAEMRPAVESLLRDPDLRWRRRAALVLAGAGEPPNERAVSELVAFWNARSTLDFEHQKELLSALAEARARASVPALLASLDDVRLRPFVADALGKIGDESARVPLLVALGREPYVTARTREAAALRTLHGAVFDDPGAPVHVELRRRVAGGSPRRERLVVWSPAAGECRVALDAVTFPPSLDEVDTHVFDLPGRGGTLVVDAPAGVLALFVAPAPLPAGPLDGAPNPP